MRLKNILFAAFCLHISFLIPPLSALSAKPRTEAQMAEAAAKTITGQWSMVHGPWSMKKSVTWWTVGEDGRAGSLECHGL